MKKDKGDCCLEAINSYDNTLLNQYRKLGLEVLKTKKEFWKALLGIFKIKKKRIFLIRFKAYPQEPDASVVFAKSKTEARDIGETVWLKQKNYNDDECEIEKIEEIDESKAHEIYTGFNCC